jgi:hypothetical protein
LLGGLTFSGPVRFFSEWQLRFRNGSAWGIAANRPHPYLSGSPVIDPIRIDEHDLQVRDRAHYLAYSALRWPAIAAALFGPLFLLDATTLQVSRILLLISVPFAVLFFSMPRAIILWTETDLDPDSEEPKPNRLPRHSVGAAMRRTTILGYNTQKQSARRGLVVAVYALLALLLGGGWFLDHLQTTGVYIYFAAYFISCFLLGGYGPSGLIKPFTGKGPRTQPMPSSLIELELYAAGNLARTSDDESRDDERELQSRDRGHYQAYQAVLS